MENLRKYKYKDSNWKLKLGIAIDMVRDREQKHLSLRKDTVTKYINNTRFANLSTKFINSTNFQINPSDLDLQPNFHFLHLPGDFPEFKN